LYLRDSSTRLPCAARRIEDVAVLVAENPR
jgi:hypothetical protein